MRYVLRFFALLGAVAVVGVYLWSGRGSPEQSVARVAEPLPTLFVPPSITPTSTPTLTATPTPSPTLTATPMPTQTPTPTQRPTLATRVLAMQAVMPGVVLSPTPTPFPSGTILLPQPPQPVEPLPDATHEPPPYSGWISFESDHPLVGYSTFWQARQIPEASQGQYHRSEDTTSYVTFPFEGEGLRVRYVAAPNMGIFEIVVDGEVIDTVDAYAEDRHFPGTAVYFVGPGTHTLTLRATGRKNDASAAYTTALDAVQVFRGSAETLIIPPSVASLVPTIVPKRVGIEPLAAPPQLVATRTPAVAQDLTISVMIAYDENGNQAVDPAEGVSGVSIRAVTVGNNRAIAQTFTDSRGYAQLEITTDVPARIVVPYFSHVWDLTGQREGSMAYTLLLEPGNQPGLIP